VQDENPFTPEYFEQMYADNPDPWNFETSEYERDKYAHTLSELPGPRFRRVLEVGCANGALTVNLAPRCDRLIAVDVAESALERARNRSTHLHHVEYHNMRIPHQTPEGPFDLVLLSEVACYWDDADLAAVAEYLGRVVENDGHVLLVHWTDPTGYPKTGDEAVELLRDLAGDRFTTIKTERPPHYRLDLWQRVGPPSA
jgi:SAM-dependent methyltransferase